MSARVLLFSARATEQAAAARSEPAEQASPARRMAPYAVEQPRGVYRVEGMVPGLVTYYAVTSAGQLVGDELRSVVPDDVVEARTVSDLARELRNCDRVPLRLLPSAELDGEPIMRAQHPRRRIMLEVLR